MQEIKQAYRRLAKSVHPDLNRDMGHDFMAHLNQAYQALSYRPESRAVPYSFQEFGFTSRPKPEPEPSRAREEAPKTRAEAASPEPAPRADGPLAAASPLARGVARTHLGPLDMPPAKSAQAISPGPAAAVSPPPTGYQLLGVDQKRGNLVYRLEVTGTPKKAVLPVRALHVCAQCGGSGRRLYGPGGLCPGCGGAGRIVKPDNMEVELPPNWADGDLVEAVTPAGQEVLVELRRSRERAGS